MQALVPPYTPLANRATPSPTPVSSFHYILCSNRRHSQGREWRLFDSEDRLMSTTKLPRVCPVCGRPFQPSAKATNQRYDTPKCKRKAEYIRLRYVAVPVEA